MRLDVEIRVHLCGVVEQDVVHGDVVSEEMLGAGNQLHGREEAAHAVHHRLGVGVHHHRLDLRDGEQGLEDVVKQRLARQRTIIFARHALAMVSHGNEGGEFHGGDYTELPPEKETANGRRPSMKFSFWFFHYLNLSFLICISSH